MHIQYRRFTFNYYKFRKVMQYSGNVEWGFSTKTKLRKTLTCELKTGLIAYQIILTIHYDTKTFQQYEQSFCDTYKNTQNIYSKDRVILTGSRFCSRSFESHNLLKRYFAHFLQLPQRNSISHYSSNLDTPNPWTINPETLNT